MLYDEFHRYFPEIKTESWQNNLLRNPFNTSVDKIPEMLQEEFIELKSDSCAEFDFKSIEIEPFWLKYSKAYPNVASEALKLLIQFSSTYLCETSFSALLSIKTKNRSRLDGENDLRCTLSEISPNIKELIKQKKCRNY